MANRTWIKVYVDKWLEGTIRGEKPALRGVWIDLLALCGSGKYSDSGQIKLNNTIGFNDFQYQKLLNLNKKCWVSAKNRLVDTERIAISGDNIITIINWHNYQSEYERVKKFRTKSTAESTLNSTALDRDRDIRDRDRDVDSRTKSTQKEIKLDQEIKDNKKRIVKRRKLQGR